MSQPLAEVEVPEVRRICVAESPEAKVEVPCPAPTVMAPPNVEVAVPVTLRFPAARLPAMVELPETKSEPVVVAFVSVALRPVKLRKDEEAVARSEVAESVVPSQVNEGLEERFVALVQKATSVLLPVPVSELPPIHAPFTA